MLAAPPLDAAAIVPTLYDPEEFAALYHVDKDRAIALVADMTEPQRVRQALAYHAGDRAGGVGGAGEVNRSRC